MRYVKLSNADCALVSARKFGARTPCLVVARWVRAQVKDWRDRSNAERRTLVRAACIHHAKRHRQTAM